MLIKELDKAEVEKSLEFGNPLEYMQMDIGYGIGSRNPTDSNDLIVLRAYCELVDAFNKYREDRIISLIPMILPNYVEKSGYSEFLGVGPIRFITSYDINKDCIVMRLSICFKKKE